MESSGSVRRVAERAQQKKSKKIRKIKQLVRAKLHIHFVCSASREAFLCGLLSLSGSTIAIGEWGRGLGGFERIFQNSSWFQCTNISAPVKRESVGLGFSSCLPVLLD